MRWTEQFISNFILILILTAWTVTVDWVIDFETNLVLALMVQAVGIVFGFRFIQSRVKKIVVRLIAPVYFDRHQRLRHLVSEIRDVNTYPEMLTRIRDTLLEVFEIDVLAIFVKQGVVYRIEKAAAPAPIVLDGIQCSLKHPLVATLRKTDSYLVPIKYSIEDLASDDQARGAISYQSFKLFRWAIPLRTEGLLTGFILVNKIPDDISSRSLNFIFLQTIDQIAVALDVKKLMHRLTIETDKKKVLSNISDRINASASRAALFNTILDQLENVMQFDACGVFLTAKDEVTIDKFLQRGYNRRRINPLKLKIGRGIVGRCIAGRKALMTRDVRLDATYIAGRNETRSELCVPIVAGKRCWGAINLESNQIARYADDDRQFLETIATQAGVTMENLELQTKMIESKFGDDMDRAEQIQRSLLPSDIPNPPDMEFNLQFVPSRQIGGDFYDLSQPGENAFLVAIGDVVGKGIPGALLMSNFYAGYQSEIKSRKSLGQIMSFLNQQLAKDENVSREVTFFLSQLETEHGVMHYVNAGHPPPMIFHRDGSWDRLEAGGPILGADKGSRYPVAEVVLQKEDLLVLYTDGVTEAVDSSGQLFDEKGIIDLVQEHLNARADEIGAALLEKIYRFTRSNLLKDDVTVILARYQPNLH